MQHDEETCAEPYQTTFHAFDPAEETVRERQIRETQQPLTLRAISKMNTEEHYQKSHNCNDEEHFSSTKTPINQGNPALTGGTANQGQIGSGGQIPPGTGAGVNTGYDNAPTGGYNNAGTGGPGYNNAGGVGYEGNTGGPGYNSGTGVAGGNPATTNASAGQKIASAIPGTQANREKKAYQNQY